MQTLVHKQAKASLQKRGAKRKKEELQFDSEDEAEVAEGEDEDPHKGKNWKVMCLHDKGWVVLGHEFL